MTSRGGWREKFDDTLFLLFVFIPTNEFIHEVHRNCPLNNNYNATSAIVSTVNHFPLHVDIMIRSLQAGIALYIVVLGIPFIIILTFMFQLVHR